MSAEAPNPEKNFSKEGKAVLKIIRHEMLLGRIPPEHAAFLAEAVHLKESAKIVTSFIIKLAALIAAVGVIINLWWKK